MGSIKRELKKFLNETFIPFGLRLSRNAMLLEFSREYVEHLNNHEMYCHPYLQCACGSNKVFNYGIPKNNGKYFHCRTCETSFKVPIYQQEWNEIYKTGDTATPKYDFWLKKYDHLIRESKDLPIIDLGCGTGNDTLYLQQQGYNTVSCDYAKEALIRLEERLKTSTTKCFDMLDGLPFNSNCHKIVVANLSLHYFSWQDTERVIGEIYRVLMKGGYLLCRVNSIKDKDNGIGMGIPVEENYFDIGGKRKRFFDEKQLRNLFIDWRIIHCFEQKMIRLGRQKIFWEVVACKQ